MVVKATCRLYVGDSEKKSIADDVVLHRTICHTIYNESDNSYGSETCEGFICPKYVSQAWIERFKLLEFGIDQEGYLYSPKSYNEAWDVHTKALWLRSVGVSPTMIGKKLKVDVGTVEKHWIDKLTRNYELRPISRYDWATIGKVVLGRSVRDKRRTVSFGGHISITKKQAPSPYHLQDEAQIMMDGTLNDVRKIVRAADKPK